MAARSCRVVLIVEDEAAIALDLEDNVERLAGHVVVGPVATITAALDAIASEKLDGAIVDIELGDGPAGPVVEALKARGVPFVFITGYTERRIPAGFEDCPIVQKSYEREQLLDLMREAANGYRNVDPVRKLRLGCSPGRGCVGSARHAAMEAR